MEPDPLCRLCCKLWKPCFSRSTVMFLLLSVLILSSDVEALQVIGGNMTVVVGGTIVLPCKLIDNTEVISQISWQRRTRGSPPTGNFITILPDGKTVFGTSDNRFQFIGSLDDSNGSLQLPNVTLMDEGTYTCTFTLFPSGNKETEIPLNLLVPPVISVEDNHLALGNEEVSLVTCTAAASKPPAEVRWLTDTLTGKVRTTTNSITHANGTTTTVSSLFGVPTREINHHLVQCVVTSAALQKEQILSFTIQVYFSPVEVIIHERAKDLFECVTEANPDANFTWTRPGSSWPQSAVRTSDATLQFLSMTSGLNGLYQCQASNDYGTKCGYLYLHVNSEACTACWTLFGLLLFGIAVAAAAAVWYQYKSGKFQRTEEVTDQMRRIPDQKTRGVEEEEEEEGHRLQDQGSY